MANLTRDQRIIRDNPTKTPYQLLQLGLSQAGYQELMSKVPEAAQVTERITPPQPQRAQPKVTKVAQQAQRPAATNNTAMAYLVNKKTKKRTLMTRASALLAQRGDKANYDVI